MTLLQIQFWRIAKYLIKKGYGCNCPEYNKDCGSCQAGDIIKWIDNHIEILR